MIVEHRKKCIICGKHFIAHKSHAKTCSNACRTALFRKKIHNYSYDLNNFSGKLEIINAMQEHHISYSIAKLADKKIFDYTVIEGMKYYFVRQIDKQDLNYYVSMTADLDAVAFVATKTAYALLLSEKAIMQMKKQFNAGYDMNLSQLLNAYFAYMEN